MQMLFVLGLIFTKDEDVVNIGVSEGFASFEERWYWYTLIYIWIHDYFMMIILWWLCLSMQYKNEFQLYFPEPTARIHKKKELDRLCRRLVTLTFPRSIPQPNENAWSAHVVKRMCWKKTWHLTWQHTPAKLDRTTLVWYEETLELLWLLQWLIAVLGRYNRLDDASRDGPVSRYVRVMDECVDQWCLSVFCVRQVFSAKLPTAEEILPWLFLGGPSVQESSFAPAFWSLLGPRCMSYWYSTSMY